LLYVLLVAAVADSSYKLSQQLLQLSCVAVAVVVVCVVTLYYTHYGPYGNALPGTYSLSTPSLLIATIRITPPDEPSLAIACAIAVFTNDLYISWRASITHRNICIMQSLN
jgi:hypothetical protein